MPLQMSPEKGKGMNCWWPMPFKKHAKIEIENDNHKGKVINPEKIPKIMDGLYFYYYVDYEIYDKWEVNDNLPTGYFHCQFRRVDYRKDVKRGFQTKKKFNFFSWQANGGCNTRENGGYDRNHILLEGEGKGQYVGCHIDIDNKFRIHSFVPGFNWPGEGDDMIFIDKDCEEGEPTLYGTGTEDYVNTAYCPTQKYDGLYHGVIKGDWRPWGKLSYYRYHILDPIPFKEKIKVTIEHGHNNLRGDIWETTAYWYQLEPHKKFPDFPSYEKRMPRRNFLKKIYTITRKLLKWFSFGAFLYLLIEFIFPLI